MRCLRKRKALSRSSSIQASSSAFETRPAPERVEANLESDIAVNCAIGKMGTEEQAPVSTTHAVALTLVLSDYRSENEVSPCLVPQVYLALIPSCSATVCRSRYVRSERILSPST